MYRKKLRSSIKARTLNLSLRFASTSSCSHGHTVSDDVNNLMHPAVDSELKGSVSLLFCSTRYCATLNIPEAL